MHVLYVTGLFALGACNLNQAGNVVANKQGDTSRALTRSSPIAEQRNACGDGQPRQGAQSLRRRPYVQQVTATSAMIGWTTTSPRDARVDITHPDGTPVTSVPAHVELGAGRDRAEQVWAAIEGLEASTLYCYAIAGLTERTGFRTAPTPDDDAPIHVLAFGDSGGATDDQRQLRNWMLGVPADLIVHTGDVAYDDGTLEQFEEGVFDIYRDLFANVPFFPAAGNHDYRTLRGKPFRNVFALPGDTREQWYSYDWGRVHFVALDTEADYATQARWLDADLAATTQPWKVVYMHKPLYSSGKHGSDLKLRALVEPILARHGVQLVLAGHDHNYERITPQRGVHHIVTGGGGRGTRDVSHSSFTALSVEVIHFVQLEIGVDEIVMHAIDAAGTEFDSAVIPRS